MRESYSNITTVEFIFGEFQNQSVSDIFMFRVSIRIFMLVAVIAVVLETSLLTVLWRRLLIFLAVFGTLLNFLHIKFVSVVDSNLLHQQERKLFSYAGCFTCRCVPE